MKISNNIKIQSIYKPYKGNDYRVLGFCKHTETGEELVYYQALYGDNVCWARPVSMFLSQIEVDGARRPRFELID